MFSHDDNDFNNLQALVEAVKQWYIHSPGHDVGTDLNKVAVAYVRYEARAGFATEQPTDRPDLPPIVPEMLASPNAQPEAQKAFTDVLDPMEKAGREALVEETRKAWEVKPPVDAGSGTAVSTSGWVMTLPDPIADEARAAYDNKYHKVRAEVSFDAWLKAYRYCSENGVTAVKGSELERLAKHYDDHGELLPIIA